MPWKDQRKRGKRYDEARESKREGSSNGTVQYLRLAYPFCISWAYEGASHQTSSGSSYGLGHASPLLEHSIIIGWRAHPRDTRRGWRQGARCWRNWRWSFDHDHHSSCSSAVMPCGSLHQPRACRLACILMCVPSARHLRFAGHDCLVDGPAKIPSITTHPSSVARDERSSARTTFVEFHPPKRQLGVPGARHQAPGRGQATTYFRLPDRRPLHVNPPILC